jgi:hypothetical protein
MLNKVAEIPEHKKGQDKFRGTKTSSSKVSDFQKGSDLLAIIAENYHRSWQHFFGRVHQDVKKKSDKCKMLCGK